MDKIAFGLLDNALDYLDQAAEHARKDTPRDWKYALLHLASGVELLLKAKLQEEHWSLVFANVDKASREAFRSGDFQSIDSKTAIERLKNILGLNQRLDDIKTLEIIRAYRNKVQHFSIEADKQAVSSLMAKGFAFTVRFVDEALTGVIDERGKSLVQKIVVGLIEYEEFVNKRMNDIAERLSKFRDIGFCPRCSQESLGLGNGNPLCLFCGLTGEPIDIVFFHKAPAVIGHCPLCGGPCLESGMDGWLCYSCGESFRDHVDG